MLYSHKIYKGIFRKVLGFLILILLGLSGLYVYLYYAVDFKEARANLEAVHQEFALIDTSFKDFLKENDKEIESGLEKGKASQSLVNSYYTLANELGIDYQIDFYPANGKDFSYGKKKRDYKSFRSYQNIMGLDRDGISTTFFRDRKDFVYVLRGKYKNGQAVLYIPGGNISAAL